MFNRLRTVYFYIIVISRTGAPILKFSVMRVSSEMLDFGESRLRMGEGDLGKGEK